MARHPKVPAPSIRFCDHRCLSASQASGTPIPCAMIRAVARERWENMHDLAAWHVIQVFVRQFAYSGAQTLSIVFGTSCLRGIAAPGAPSGAPLGCVNCGADIEPRHAESAP